MSASARPFDTVTARPVRTALVGFGGSGSRIHAKLLDALPEYHISTIVTSHARAAALDRHPAAIVVSDVSDLEPGSIDLAVVTARDDRHVELGSQMLQLGIPTVIEKPLAPTSAEVQQLQHIAQANGVPVVAFQNRRWDADFRTALAALNSGALGTPLRFEAALQRWSPGIWNNWRQRPRPGTVDGPVADIGSHLVDQAVFAFGAVTDVYAEFDVRRPLSEVVDDAFLSLRHENGVRSHLTFGSMWSAATPSYTIQGTQAAVQTTGIDGQMAASMNDVGPLDAEWGSFATWQASLWPGDGTSEPLTPVRSDGRGFYRELFAMLRNEEPSPVPGEETLLTLRVLEAAIRSAETGHRVDVAR